LGKVVRDPNRVRALGRNGEGEEARGDRRRRDEYFIRKKKSLEELESGGRRVDSYNSYGKGRGGYRGGGYQ